MIKLPKVLNPYFAEIFEHLDNKLHQNEYNIDTYNVRVTSLEEVFNALGEEEMEKQNSNTLGANTLDDEDRQLEN